MHKGASTPSSFSFCRVEREFQTLELQSQCRHPDFYEPAPYFCLVIMTACNFPAIFKAIYFLKSLKGAKFFIIVSLEALSLSAFTCLWLMKQFSEKYEDS